jgi:hypothetical protein
VPEELLQEMGPIDYLCVEFPDGSLNGKAFPLLLDLVDRGIVRILDILFVKKSMDGSVFAVEGKDLDLADLGVFHGAASGLIGGDDLREVGSVLTAGSAAVVLVYENTWAAPLAVQLRRSGAQLVAGGRIPVQALLAALDELEPEDASAVSTGSSGGR